MSARVRRPGPVPAVRLAARADLVFCLALGVAAGAVVAGCKGTPEVVAAGKLNVTADANGFTPGAVKVQKGAPLELVFTRTTDESCATQVVFPELGVTKDLPLNTPVSVTIPTKDARTLAFQCGMGMYKSKVVIQ